MVLDERGYWLYLTGNRHGDLRRHMRHDKKSVSDVYPFGVYVGGHGYYFELVDLDFSTDEERNPHFTGCMGRGQ